MVFKRVEQAQKSWRRLNGPSQLPKVIEGVKFKEGIEAETDRNAEAPASPGHCVTKIRR